MDTPEFEASKCKDGSWEVRFSLPQKGYTKREAANLVRNLNQAVADWEAKSGNEDIDADAASRL